MRIAKGEVRAFAASSALVCRRDSIPGGRRGSEYL